MKTQRITAHEYRCESRPEKKTVVLLLVAVAAAPNTEKDIFPEIAIRCAGPLIIAALHRGSQAELQMVRVLKKDEIILQQIHLLYIYPVEIGAKATCLQLNNRNI